MRASERASERERERERERAREREREQKDERESAKGVERKPRLRAACEQARQTHTHPNLIQRTSHVHAQAPRCRPEVAYCLPTPKLLVAALKSLTACPTSSLRSLLA
eukprot:5329870-Pleurochrysis_carterae.AAC.1